MRHRKDNSRKEGEIETHILLSITDFKKGKAKRKLTCRTDSIEEVILIDYVDYKLTYQSLNKNYYRSFIQYMIMVVIFGSKLHFVAKVCF